MTTYIDNTSALERVYHQNINLKWGSVLDDTSLFLRQEEEEATTNNNNLSWRVGVDVGFRYLVRIHWCEVAPKMEFMLLIDTMIALTSADILLLQQGQGEGGILWYNYVLMVEGQKREGKRTITISISLNSQHQFYFLPLQGFEVFKLSNHDRSLASPNPLLPPTADSPSPSQTLLYSLLGRGNAIATLVFSLICVVNIFVHSLQKTWGADMTDDHQENKPSARANLLCRIFTLSEIQSATGNFHSTYIIGKGGFGIVYKGFIDYRRDIVAIKRSKPDSKQGELQFWTG